MTVFKTEFTWGLNRVIPHLSPPQQQPWRTPSCPCPPACPPWVAGSSWTWVSLASVTWKVPWRFPGFTEEPIRSVLFVAKNPKMGRCLLGRQRGREWLSKGQKQAGRGRVLHTQRRRTFEKELSPLQVAGRGLGHTLTQGDRLGQCGLSPDSWGPKAK